MSSRSVIDKTFTIKDVQTLFDNKNLQFVKNRPVNSRAYKFLKSLEIEELTPVSVLQRMTETKEDSLKRWVKSLTTKQLSEVYAYLNKGMVDILRDYEKYEEYSYYADSSYENSSYYKEEHQYALIYQRTEKALSKIKQLQIVRGTDDIVIPISESASSWSFVRLLINFSGCDISYSFDESELSIRLL